MGYINFKNHFPEIYWVTSENRNEKENPSTTLFDNVHIKDHVGGGTVF